MSDRHEKGQALLELAIGVPLLMIILAGGYVACRTAFLSSRAGSAAHHTALRIGRRLGGMEKTVAASIVPPPGEVTIRSGGGKSARLLPPPFPTLAGRSRGVVSVRKSWGEIGCVTSFDPARIDRESEMSADCWTRGSPSGRKIRQTVRARVALGILR